VPGRNKHEAFRAFIEPMQRVLHAIEPAARLQHNEFADGSYSVTMNDGLPQEMKTNGTRLGLHIAMTVECVPRPEHGDFKMSTLRYVYEIHGLNGPSRIFGWHWHPKGKSHYTNTHIHVPPGLPFSKCHVPAGRIAMEEVLILMVDEMGVQPYAPTWRDTLDEVMGKHLEHRTWSGSNP
jgi:hypothetical protein